MHSFFSFLCDSQNYDTSSIIFDLACEHYGEPFVQVCSVYVVYLCAWCVCVCVCVRVCVSVSGCCVL